jgi:predicted cobalt transporter CbtA
MNLDLRPFFILWIAVATIVVALIIRRKMIASHEDDSLHVLEGNALAEQTAVAHKLESIDKWGKILTVVAVLIGLFVGGAYLYQFWVHSTQIQSGL